MSQSVQIEIAAAWIDCCECGMSFAVPALWQKERRRTKQAFYCPNGHQQGYFGESREEKRIAELEAEAKRLRERASAAWEDADLQRKAREQTQRRLSATKGVLTRTKNRVAKGVCPCCNRTFANLAAHMQTKHPEYADEPDS